MSIDFIIDFPPDVRQPCAQLTSASLKSAVHTPRRRGSEIHAVTLTLQEQANEPPSTQDRA